VTDGDEAASSGFAAGEQAWRARLGTFRQVVRQELVSRQLAEHLPDGVSSPRRVLDIGCGQGTQALRLARLGHQVTGLDASALLLGDFAAALRGEPPEVRERVRLVHAEAGRLPELFAPAALDAVLCHGVLMYLPDPSALLTDAAKLLAPGGLLSLLVRNGDALAMRPGLLGDWAATVRAFTGTAAYRNRIGVDARADRLHELAAALTERGLEVRAWYGVRVFTDVVPLETPLPAADQLAAVFEAEEHAGRTDPYRRVAGLIHLIAEPGPADGLRPINS
jgi:SAM-dependent methyltransferase